MLHFNKKENVITCFRKSLELQEQLVHYYEQASRPERKARDLQPGLVVEAIQVKAESGEIIGKVTGGAARELLWQQLHALYDAVGHPSGWWPLADLSWNAKSFFADMEMYLLRYRDKAIGFACLERAANNNPEHTSFVYIGIIPSQQGKGFGGAFFENILEKAWSGETQKLLLNTAPEYDLMAGYGAPRPAAELYKKIGFQLVKTELRTPHDGRLNELNLPGFYLAEAEHYSGNDLSVFYEERLEGAKICMSRESGG